MKLPTIEERMTSLLRNVAKESRPCKACGEQLYFVMHQNGKVAPYTATGVNHFIDCPGASQFRKRGVPA